MAYGVTASWLFLGAVAALVSPSFQDPPAVDPCKCEVVNKVKMSESDCKCNLPGDPDPVEAYDSSTPVFPEGLPEDGVCNKAPCAGDNTCTFQVVATTVTIAACARKCTGHKETSSCVRWKRTGLVEAGTVGSEGCHDFGVAVTYIGLPPGPNYSACGTPQVEDVITFYKSNGNVAFKLTFSYGCGSCPQSQS